MASSSSVPWYNRPAREFPAKRWLRERYGFSVPPAVFARLGARPLASGRREFPARVWRAKQRAGGLTAR